MPTSSNNRYDQRAFAAPSKRIPALLPIKMENRVAVHPNKMPSRFKARQSCLTRFQPQPRFQLRPTRLQLFRTQFQPCLRARLQPCRKFSASSAALAAEVRLSPRQATHSSQVTLSSSSAVVPLASRYPKALALGLSAHPPTGALAPAVCLPIPRKTHHHKLILSFTLTATLITSCSPPKPVPKTTTHIT